MGFEWAVTNDGGDLTGVDLRRHRAEHLLLGKGACRRLAKLLPGHAVDNGTAAEVPFALAEWLSSVVLRLGRTRRRRPPDHRHTNYAAAALAAAANPHPPSA